MTFMLHKSIRIVVVIVTVIVVIVIVIVIMNNYSPKRRWLAMDGKYPTLATDTEVNSCFILY